MTDDTRTGPRLIGSLQVTAGKGGVRMEDVYETGADDLWSALTDPERLARWVARVEGDLRLGGEFRASFTSSWEGPGRVEVCDPPRRLLLTMEPGAADSTVIEAVLTPEGEDRTRLVIEERGLPVPEFVNHGAGWQAHVEDLTAYLAGREPVDWHTRWTQLIPSYRSLARDRGLVPPGYGATSGE
jgi:uncharacterized protein YndB with AHSA1/START domain